MYSCHICGAGRFTSFRSLPRSCRSFGVSALDFDLDTRREFEFHQRVDCLRRRRVDVDDTLESAELELLASLLVYEGRAVYRINLLVRRERHRTADHCIGALYGLDNLLGRLIHQIVVERLQFDSNFLIHILYFYSISLRLPDFSIISLARFAGTSSKCENSIDDVARPDEIVRNTVT